MGSIDRPLFTDGWNSFFHYAIGILAVWIGNHMVFIFFLGYQLKDSKDKNLFVDISEFLSGFFRGLLSFLFPKAGI
jgi:hypothetical protein